MPPICISAVILPSSGGILRTIDHSPLRQERRRFCQQYNTQITGTHAGNRTTLPLINNYTIEDSIIYYLILL
jgi:hypothetical protein